MDFADSALMVEALDSFNSIALNVAQKLLTSRGLRSCVSEYDRTEVLRDHVSAKTVRLASMRPLAPRIGKETSRFPIISFGTTYRERSGSDWSPTVMCAALNSFVSPLDEVDHARFGTTYLLHSHGAPAG